MVDEVFTLTELLRESDDEVWTALRSALRGRGVDARGSLLAFSVEQGDDSEFAVLVTDRDEIATLSWQPSTGSIFEWTLITDSWRDSPYRDDVARALQLRSSK